MTRGDDATAAESASGASEDTADEFAGLGYEQARDELTTIVRALEAGGATLEESLALWERGEALAAVCRRWLDGAAARLDAAARRHATTSDTTGSDTTRGQTVGDTTAGDNTATSKRSS
ncbi:MAG: exodeoxyribonuclease VII small subunit [Actinomycetota bacterium]|nr:MAG: exodeoxyribonuclease VII small subunit [Actinomycetota bacterium]